MDHHRANFFSRRKFNYHQRTMTIGELSDEPHGFTQCRNVAII